jgi:3-hydroxyacyl-[acyl-carrier-protein] dehydratase
MDPRDILPHRPPFLFLDEIEQLSDTAGVARYRFPHGEPYFAGHFPGNPVVPGVLQIESIAQLMVAVGLHSLRGGEKIDKLYFSLVQEARFHRPLRPGDEVRVRVERDWLRLKTIQVRGTLHEMVSGELVCEAVLRGSGG